jgi:Transmembrane domain of unknown function (DUF3566)
MSEGNPGPTPLGQAPQQASPPAEGAREEDLATARAAAGGRGSRPASPSEASERTAIHPRVVLPTSSAAPSGPAPSNNGSTGQPSVEPRQPSAPPSAASRFSLPGNPAPSDQRPGPTAEPDQQPGSKKSLFERLRFGKKESGVSQPEPESSQASQGPDKVPTSPVASPTQASSPAPTERHPGQTAGPAGMVAATQHQPSFRAPRETEDRIPAESSPVGRSPEAHTDTAIIPAVEAALLARPSANISADRGTLQPKKPGAARRTRKARLRLSRLDPWSVMKTSFLFSIAAGVMLVVAVYVVWTVIGSSGLFDSVNEMVKSVVSTPGDTTPFLVQDYINTQKVMGVAALLACVDVVIFTALATLGSFLYNLAATMLGGLEITLAED